MTNRIYIFVNGILNSPGDAHAWTDRAASWINANTEYKGEKFEYFCGPISRRLFQSKHAHDLAEEIEQFTKAGAELVLVGHSNGCDLILRALLLLHWSTAKPFPIEALHLISGACNPNFQDNGLNPLLTVGVLREVTVYTGGADSHFCHPMWLARQSQRLIGWAGLGYGDLGAVGPQNVRSAVAGRVHLISQPLYDHSTWFTSGPFEQLMASITSVESVPSPAP